MLFNDVSAVSRNDGIQDVGAFGILIRFSKFIREIETTFSITYCESCKLIFVNLGLIVANKTSVWA